MNSKPDTKDVLIASADKQLARVRERIARIDEDMARVTERFLKAERDDARNPSARPGDDARNPAAGPSLQPPRGKPAAPGLSGLLPVGLLLAACLIVAALVSQIAAPWTQQHVSTSFSQPTNPPLSAQPGPSFKLITAEAVPVQAAPLARTGPQDAAPAAAGVSELMQMQQTLARDVANLKQEIEQLKVKSDQIAADNSKAIEQLKAKQDEMARLSAKLSEQSQPPNTSPSSAAPTQSLARMRPQTPPPRRRYPPRRYYDDEW
jgi:septal ring factor EnvC (AmiA/AmiB activator)